MDRGAWWATVHGVAKSWTRLNDLATVQDDVVTQIWQNLTDTGSQQKLTIFVEINLQ